MSTHKKDSLIDLLLSLDKTEKRYVRLFLEKNSIRKENHYVRFFDAVSGLKHYDQNYLKQELKSYPNILNNIRVLKHQLYKKILLALTYYHSESSSEATLDKILHQVDILMNKNLYEQAEKLLNQGEKLATQNENFAQLLRILNLKTDLNQLKTLKAGKNELYKLLIKRTKILKKLDRINEYVTLNHENFIRSYNLHPDPKENTPEAIQKLRNNPLYQDINLAESAREKAIFLGNHMSDNLRSRNIAEVYRFCKMKLELHHEYPHLYQDFSFDYVGNLYTLLFAASMLPDKKAEFDTYFKTLLDFPNMLGKKMNARTATFYYQVVYYLQLRSLHANNTIYKATDIASEVETFFNEYENQTEAFLYDLVIYYYIAYGFFCKKDYKNTIKFLNRILYKPQKSVRIDILALVRILQIMIHFEQENYELVDSLALSLSRFLSKNGTIKPFENIFLKFMRHEAQSFVSKQDKQEGILELKEKLLKIKPQLGYINAYFNVFTWLDASYEGKSIEQYLKGK